MSFSGGQGFHDDASMHQELIQEVIVIYFLYLLMFLIYNDVI